MLIVEFESSEYTVREDEGTVTYCLTTNHGHDEPVIVTVSERHVTTSGKKNFQFY